MSEVFGKDSIFLAYAKWHYGRGLKEFFVVVGNFLWFIAHFFSFELLFKTLFAPWKRLGEKYEGGFNLGAWTETAVVNILMRAVGLMTKMVVLVVGFATYLVLVAFVSGILMIWILAPAVILGSAVLSATFFVI